MSAPSSVRRLRRTSNSSVPSDRTSGQSAAATPGTRVALTLGPTSVASVTVTVTRVPAVPATATGVTAWVVASKVPMNSTGIVFRSGESLDVSAIAEPYRTGSGVEAVGGAADDRKPSGHRDAAEPQEHAFEVGRSAGVVGEDADDRHEPDHPERDRCGCHESQQVVSHTSRSLPASHVVIAAATPPERARRDSVEASGSSTPRHAGPTHSRTAER